MQGVQMRKFNPVSVKIKVSVVNGDKAWGGTAYDCRQDAPSALQNVLCESCVAVEQHVQAMNCD